MKYNVNDVYITKYVVYDNNLRKFVDLPRYCLPYKIVIRCQDDYYSDFRNNNSCCRYYKKYKDNEERRLKIFWGELYPIDMFLKEDERIEGKITYERLEELYYTVNAGKSKRPYLRLVK